MLLIVISSASHSVSQTGVGAAAAQPAEADVAAGQRPVPGVPAPPDEGHAENRERAVLRTAPPGGGDEEEGPGTAVVTHRFAVEVSAFT